MNDKAIAINTILLLVVGMIVVGVMVYLVYTFTSGPTMSVQQCKAKMIQYCTLCANTNCGDIPTPSELNTACANYPELSNWGNNNNCQVGTGNTPDDCEALGVKYLCP